MLLYTDAEAQAALDTIKQVADYNLPLMDVTHGASSGQPLCTEGQYYQASKNIYHGRQEEDVSEFEELGDAPHPYCEGLLARQMARLMAYLRKHGGWQLVTTQALGNCLYSSVLRGTDCKKEFVSMHLRRLLIMLLSAYPDFFFNYLKHAIASTYGQDRPTPEEIDERERAGKLTAAEAHELRMPGPFSFSQYCQHLLTDGTWGDDLSLTLISCMWQISITILQADTFGEIRIRHDRPLRNVDLVVVFIDGDHYMGAG